MENGCLTPTKKAFPNRESAVVGAHAMGLGHLHPYICSCNQWHLTSRRTMADEAPTVVVEVLKTASDVEFISLVRAEVYGKASAEEAAALRSEELCPRWADALKSLIGEMNQRMLTLAGRKDQASKRGRLELQQRIQSVAARRKEARQLIASSKRAQHMTSRELRVKRRAKRQEAGDRAIERLIDAHRDEFRAYFEEEQRKDTV